MITYKELKDRVELIAVFGYKDENYLSYSYILSKILQDDKLSAEELIDLRDAVNEYVDWYMKKSSRALTCSRESMNYVDRYLQGEMYKDQSEPDAYAEIQRENLRRALSMIEEVE